MIASAISICGRVDNRKWGVATAAPALPEVVGVMDYAGHMPPRLIYQQRRDGAKGGLRCNIRQMQVHLLNIAAWEKAG